VGYELIYSPSAQNDLEEIVRYAAQDNPQAALKLGYYLDDRAHSLTTNPLRGSQVRQRPGVRKLVCGSYLIFYQIRESLSAIEVLRFWHGARDRRTMSLR
jgi:addiction module RelE/StbE family toxin